MKSVAIVAMVCALPLAAAAETNAMPRIFNGMEKGANGRSICSSIRRPKARSCRP